MTKTRSPDLAEVLRASLDARLQELHTALPAKVEKFNKDEQTVDAKPLLQRTEQLDDGTEVTEPLPVITDVPVMFPRSGKFFFTFPIEKGDHVLLIFNERSIDKFIEKGDDTDPVDFRQHHLADAVAYPGFYPKPSKLSGFDSEAAVIGHVDESTDFLTLAGVVNARFKAIEDWLVNTLTIYAQTHEHSYIPPLIPAPIVPAPTTPPHVPPLVVPALSVDPDVGVDTATKKTKAS